MALTGQLDLNALLVFDAVVEAGSFTAAADRLGIAKAKVSIQVARLEALLGAALFARTTRRVTLTDAGRALHAECHPLLHGITEAVDRVGARTTELSGTLRLSTSVDHAVQSLAAAVASFADEHPRLQIDLRTSDRVVDLVSEGIDLSIRLGWLRDSSLRAVKLGEFSQYLVASPGYVQRAGLPTHPQELGGYAWVALTLLPTPLTWQFTAREGKVHTAHVKTRLRVDSPGALAAMLRQGAGISVLDQYTAQENIASGKLVRLLPEWQLPTGGIYAVYPPGRHVSARVRAFIDFYRESLRTP